MICQRLVDVGVKGWIDSRMTFYLRVPISMDMKATLKMMTNLIHPHCEFNTVWVYQRMMMGISRSWIELVQKHQLLIREKKHERKWKKLWKPDMPWWEKSSAKSSHIGVTLFWLTKFYSLSNSIDFLCSIWYSVESFLYHWLQWLRGEEILSCEWIGYAVWYSPSVLFCYEGVSLVSWCEDDDVVWL